jgi:phenylpropionate dioxygenase-like ring-hydroxylating dioxygenase large terminal subunit
MATGWERPELPETHYVDNRVYTDRSLFDEELSKIFSRTWLFVCHASEIAKAGDFRTTSVAGRQIVIVRQPDGQVASFYNVCRHRGAPVVLEEAGNAKHFQCFYHHWNYAIDGRLLGMTGPEGYRKAAIDKTKFGLVPLRTEVAAGLVFVCADPETESLRDYLGACLNLFEEPLGALPLEVFHSFKTVVPVNWKLLHHNNAEGYHNLLHVLNRRTSRYVATHRDSDPTRAAIYPRGHSSLYSAQGGNVSYDHVGVTGVMEGVLPGMRANEIRVINPFPDLLVNIRSNVVRLDRFVPIAVDQTLVEFRGLGVQGDSKALRDSRIAHHNMFWGPAGRNLPEDLRACALQQRSIASGVVRYSIIAREEELRASDDAGLRAFFAEWRSLMGRAPNAPFDAAS